MDSAKQEFQAFERDGWNEVAGEYGEFTAGVTSEVSEALLDAANVSGGSRVVDVASGPGWTAAVAAERGAATIGVDISEAMVAQASSRFPEVDFRVGSAEELPLEDRSVDAVVSAFGMPHFADHAAFVAESARALDAGGRIAFASWYPPQTNPFFGVALGSIAKHGDLNVPLPEGLDMFTWADDAACDELLSAAGFGPCERVDVPLAVRTANGVDTVIGFLENASVRSRALFGAQTAEAQAAITTSISEMLAPMETDGQWTIPLNAFVVSASKLH